MTFRHIITIAALALPMAASAQTTTDLLHIDFETTTWKSVGVFDLWEASPFRTGLLAGNCALSDNPTKDELNPVDGQPVNPSEKVLAVQRSRYGSNAFGACIHLKTPFDLNATPKYIHAWIHTPKTGRAMIAGLGKRKDRPGQSENVVQFTAITGAKLETGRWQEIVLPATGNEGVQIHSLVIVPDCESPHDLKEDFAVYIDNVIVNDSPRPTLITGYYPINIDKKQAYTRTDRHLDIVKLTIDGKTQSYSIPAPKKPYTDAGAAEFFARAGQTVIPAVTFTGNAMHSYVYVDVNQDGQFDTNKELFSYSYYQGKNSEGKVAGKNAIAPRPFQLPSDLQPGIYRMRYKIDWDNIDPMGAGELLKNGGGFVDIRLNIHGDYATVRQQNLNGAVLTADEKPLESFKAPFGKDFTIKMDPADGFEYAGIILKHGYNLATDSLVKDNVQWESIRIPRVLFNDDNTYTIPGRWMDGEIAIEGLFIEKGTYKPEPAPQWYARYTPTQIVNGQFPKTTQWYTIQIGEQGYVLQANGTQAMTLSATEVNKDNPAQLWCFVGNNETGFRIYNYSGGTAKVLAAPINMGSNNGGNTYPTLQPAGALPKGYVDVWRFEDSNALGKSGAQYAFMYEDGHVANKVNNRNNKFAFWSGGADKGSTLTILPAAPDNIAGLHPVVAVSVSAPAYDLTGRRVESTERGVIVQQGRKSIR